jgi:hypothetical protein
MARSTNTSSVWHCERTAVFSGRHQQNVGFRVEDGIVGLLADILPLHNVRIFLDQNVSGSLCLLVVEALVSRRIGVGAKDIFPIEFGPRDLLDARVAAGGSLRRGDAQRKAIPPRRCLPVEEVDGSTETGRLANIRNTPL